MRRLTVLLAIVAAMMFTVVPAASAHVHAFTPLQCHGSGNAGALVGFVKAADAASPMTGGPIIPENASGERPSGGQGIANAC